MIFLSINFIIFTVTSVVVIDTIIIPTIRNHVGIGFECRVTLIMHKAHVKKKHVDDSLLPKRKNLTIVAHETTLIRNAAMSKTTEIIFNKLKIMACKSFARSDLSTIRIQRDSEVRSWEP